MNTAGNTVNEIAPTLRQIVDMQRASAFGVRIVACQGDGTT
jgi:hypothetical protein